MDLRNDDENKKEGVGVNQNIELDQNENKIETQKSTKSFTSTCLTYLRDFGSFAFQGTIVELCSSILMAKAMSSVVEEIVDDFLLPVLRILSSKRRGPYQQTHFLVLKSGAKNDITQGAYKYKTLFHAKEDGAITMNFGIFFVRFAYFISVAVTVYSFIRLLVHVRSENSNEDENGEELVETKKCCYCFSKISVGAQRCAFCRTWDPHMNENNERNAKNSNNNDQQNSQNDSESKNREEEIQNARETLKLKKKFATLRKSLKKQLKNLLQGGFLLEKE